jgi:hypothetical protein
MLLSPGLRPRWFFSPFPIAVMKRLFSALAIFVGIWLLGSFCGVMFDAAHKNLWTQSLMWALLSSVILAPVFLFVGTTDSGSSPPAAPGGEPFEVEGSMEVHDQNGTDEREGWPYTSESEESSSGSPAQ